MFRYLGIFFAAAAILILCPVASAQEKKAPPLNAQDWINAEKDATLETFEGKVIFLEFTATW